MTGSQVNDLASSFVAMASAFEKLPQVEADLAEARSNINGHLATIQRLELRLQDRANEIAQLQSDKRTVEAERDEAIHTFLEADDRTKRALEFIKATFGSAGSLIQALEPPRAEVAQPVDAPAVTAEAGQSAVGEPNASTVDQSPNVNTPTVIVPVNASGPSTEPAPEVAPASDPTIAVTQVTDASAPSSATSLENAPSSTTTSEPFSMPPIDPGIYHGLSYSEAHAKFGTSFSWPSKDEWLSNGGTLDQFYA